MTDYRSYKGSEKRQIIDYNYVMSLPDDKVMICVSPRYLEICRYLANTRGLWRTTYALEYLENGYLIPDPEQMREILNIIAEGQEDMTTCNDIAEALEAIASAISQIQSGGCGCGSGSNGAGQDPPPINNWDGTGDYPPGFPSTESWNAHKCKAVQFALDKIIMSYNEVGTLQLYGLTVYAVAQALLQVITSPISFIGLLQIAPSLISIFNDLDVFQGIATELSDDRDDLVCLMYNETTAQAMADQLKAQILDRIYAHSFPAVIESALVVYTEWAVSPEAINRVYEPNSQWEGGYDDTICGSCEDPGCPIIAITYGSLVGEIEPNADGVEFTVTSAEEGGYAKIFVETSDDPCGPENICWEVVSMTGTGGTGGNIHDLDLDINTWDWTMGWAALLANHYIGEYGVFYGIDATPITMTFRLTKLGEGSPCDE